MTDETAAPSGGNDISVVSLPADAPESFASEHAAARYFATLHEKKPEKSTAESAEQATADPELSSEDNAASVEEQATGETKEGDEAEKPPLELPRSWTKDQTDRWSSFDRDTQEFLLEHERKTTTGTNQRLSEAAEIRKAAEAERATIAEERQKYINGLTAQDKILEQEMVEQFPNIKSMADLEFLANEALRASNDGDAVRAGQIQAYLTAFNTKSQKIATVRADLKAADERQANEQRAKWTDHVRTEGAKFAESLSVADKAKITEFMTAAPEFLEGRGFSRQELIEHWDGGKLISFHDHRFQSLILDGMKFRNLQNAPKAVVKQNLPPVQRPGTARPQGQAASERAQVLDKSLTNSGDLKDAVALLQARRGRR